ncbi:PEP-CTERM sorting domain-containing protein [Nostocaceae cyanobacterium CENA369]|uniref:PEP-CTERM sorting domain-containing protein n=1 Tax=Dendronalium phyllosphericum CENA369 TaxID=1725256 RepID=A0A8J7LHK3_9NOST|nr:PEP-CTERM sorting domain-containing protein [Dendronalium phyllosphericum]MBH8578182.1 PEP-CTERM sorting domain-containing protein [Dendronalium phyllosphericum CENA369]
MITIKNSLITAGTASLLSLGSLALTSPSYAFNLNLSSWSKIGDVNPISSTQATLNSGTFDTAPTGGGAGSLEDFLSITPGSLDPATSTFGATQGSAIKQTFTDIKVGDVLHFDYSFLTNDADSAFVTINDSVIALTASTPFTYSFTSAGSYNVGIGIVDVDDAIGASQLIVSNAKLDAVPEPMTILGSLTALSFGVGMRRRFGRKKSASSGV